MCCFQLCGLAVSSLKAGITSADKKKLGGTGLIYGYLLIDIIPAMTTISARSRLEPEGIGCTGPSACNVILILLQVRRHIDS